ncbi:MAG: hypothetical protein R3E01_21300 [Pirellulaceae bacterium]|nr:hypothetical protein [Planctomycetales bacterium]
MNKKQGSPPATGKPRWYFTVWGRLTLLAATAAAVWGLELSLENWLWPQYGSAMAIQQLTDSSHAAQTLRSAALMHEQLPLIAAVLVAGVAMVLFLPGYRRRLQLLRRELA